MTPLERRLFKDRENRKRYLAKHRDAINAHRRKKYALRVRIPRLEAKLARLKALVTPQEKAEPR